MVSLNDIGLEDPDGRNGLVSILVGPNGSGKSTVLVGIAKQYKSRRNVIIISNTPHDRFVNLRGAKRISVGRTDQRPSTIVKRSVAESLSGYGSDFFQISAILEHCGYEPRFGFEIERNRYYGYSVGELRDEINTEYNLRRNGSSKRVPNNDQDLEMAMSFLQRHSAWDRLWIDARESAYDFSRSMEFASVLKMESLLRKWQVIRGVRVILKRKEGGGDVELQNASSGQLALISTLLYLITNVGDNPIIIIDEPENSLHPSWQHSYVEKVLAAMQYKQISLLVATHAPLVVTGALAINDGMVSVFSVRNNTPTRLSISSDTKNSQSIESILWDAFEVVTPANHFISEEIIDKISQYQKGNIPKEEVISLIDRMKAESFDIRQRNFFQAVKQLVDKVQYYNETGN